MFDSYDRRVIFDSMTGGSTHEFLSNPNKSSESLEKEVKSYSASKTKELHKIILKVVESQENVQNNARECKKLFRQKANPETLIQLEEELKTQREDYEYYIKDFLPTLKKEITKSKKLGQIKKTKIEKIIMELITNIFNENSNKDHSGSTIQSQGNHGNGQIDRQGNAMEPFNKQSFSGEGVIAESSDSSALERDSLAKGVSGKGTTGTYNILRNSGYYSASTVPTSKQSQARKEKISIAQSQLNGSFSQSCEDLKNKDPSTTVDAVEVLSVADTSRCSSDSDSEINSPITNEESLSPLRNSSLTSVTSTFFEEKLNLALSFINEDQMQPEQVIEADPQVQESGNSSDQIDQVKKEMSSQCLTRKKESISQATQMISNQKEDSVQSEKKEEKASNNQNNSEVKQPNLHVALVTGCTLLAMGCIVAGAMTSGLGLFAMAAVFAIAAVVELCSNFLSSKLTSINVSSLIDSLQHSKN